MTRSARDAYSCYSMRMHVATKRGSWFRRVLASLGLLAFAGALLSGPLLAIYVLCSMPCCGQGPMPSCATQCEVRSNKGPVPVVRTVMPPAPAVRAFPVVKPVIVESPTITIASDLDTGPHHRVDARIHVLNSTFRI